MTDRALVAALASAALLQVGHPTQAAPVGRGVAGPPSASATCVLKGVAEPRANSAINDAQGRPIARFSGAPTTLLVTDFPTDAQGRVRVQTGSGTGGFRLRGYLATADLPLYSAVPLPVVAGHVWLAAGTALVFGASAPGRLRVERLTTGVFSQTFVTWANCSAFSLGASLPAPNPPLGNARGYLLKKSRLALFDRPEGTLLLQLNRAPNVEQVLFFSNERQGEWLAVSHHGELVIEGWAKVKDLEALPVGETSDSLPPRVTQRSPAQLAVRGEPRVVQPLGEVPLRAQAKESEASIGVIEPGAETYVLDVVAGWASVMPKALNIIPGPDGQFWVKTSDLGI